MGNFVLFRSFFLFLRFEPTRVSRSLLAELHQVAEAAMEGTLVSGLIAHPKGKLFGDGGIVEIELEAGLLKANGSLDQPIMARHVHYKEPFCGGIGIVLNNKVVDEPHEFGGVFRG